MQVLIAIRTLTLVAGLQAVEPAHATDETIEVLPSEVSYVEASWLETSIHARPWVPHHRIATITRGTHLVVRGEVESRDNKGCHGKRWYAVYPYGYVCSEQVRTAKTPPETGTALPVSGDRRLPYDYALVRTDDIAMYNNLEALEQATPSRTLKKGMSLAIRRTREVDGVEYLETMEGRLVPKEGTGWMGQGSDLSGVALTGGRPGPAFAWVFGDKTPVYAKADPTSDRIDTLKNRQRVRIFEDNGKHGKDRWRRIGKDRWVQASRLNEVVFIDPPAGVLGKTRLEQRGNDQWIDVDTGEQVLVAYRGKTPVFATLVSSGRGHPTPLGNYPIWAKVASMTMANQAYEDNPYMVEHVPWVMLFQGHNAIHGAYWHNRFGRRKSHGCVNLAPHDARWLFDWVSPPMPAGWTGYLPSDLERSVTVHVRDSSKPEGEQFVQERKLGPPDREEEQRRLEEAEKRRAAAAEAEAAEAAEAEAAEATPAIPSGPESIPRLVPTRP